MDFLVESLSGTGTALTILSGREAGEGEGERGDFEMRTFFVAVFARGCFVASWLLRRFVAASSLLRRFVATV
jgi:hypothetical protein